MSSAESVYSLKSLAESCQTKLAEMVSYFGESSEGPEPTKPEDVFEMILAFSSSLQVSYYSSFGKTSGLTQISNQKAALDVNATMARALPSVVIAANEESVSNSH